jgi:hypothetical protein
MKTGLIKREDTNKFLNANRENTTSMLSTGHYAGDTMQVGRGDPNPAFTDHLWAEEALLCAVELYQTVHPFGKTHPSI